MPVKCAEEGCEKPARVRDHCQTHYARKLRRGELKARRREPDPIKRFWSKVDRKTEAECWLWLSAKTNGYGVITIERRVRSAHRLAYELLVGQIPEGLHIDHLCRNRACVNPRHLEPVTQRENTARGDSRSATAIRLNRCINGHELVPDNVRISNGSRCCRTCERERALRYYHRQKSA